MLYLIDANVLIDAQRDYYPIDRVPEFWAWLLHQAKGGDVKMTQEILDEILDTKDTEKGKADPLVAWCVANQKHLVLDEDSDLDAIQKVTEEGYGTDLTDDELEEIGKDPFQIAAAFIDVPQRTVVTTEASAPRKQRQNRRIPDVCDDFGIKHCDTFRLIRDLGFSTDWDKKRK